MKHFLFCLLLIGCVHNGPVDSIPVPIQVARATNGKTNWSCQLKELNSSSADVECTFYNTSDNTDNVCIKVSYSEEIAGRLVLVAQSQEICSENLVPDGFRIKSVSFEKDKRRALQRCGELLDSCVMLAGVH